MKGQRGQALILVLILLAVGSLTIVPVLAYTSTGLHSQRISEDVIANQYVADASLEDALWKLLNQLLGSLNPDNPEDQYSVDIGGGSSGVSIKVPTVQPSEPVYFPPITLTCEVDPNWVETYSGVVTTHYIIRVDSPQWNFSEFGLTLPPGLTYTPNSTYRIGPVADSPILGKFDELNATAEVRFSEAVPQAWIVNKKDGNRWQDMIGSEYVEVDYWPPVPYDPNTFYLLFGEDAEGRQTLTWMPVFSGSGRGDFIQTIEVTGFPPPGISYVEPYFLVQGLTEPWELDPTAALGVAFYTIGIEVGGVNYEVIVAYDSASASFQIVSYQIVG